MWDHLTHLIHSIAQEREVQDQTQVAVAKQEAITPITHTLIIDVEIDIDLNLI